ncbi:MAG TPA: TIGR04282 family arsenosugar biosynthesis glycosyltransferase [Ktedonobacteraceae bacterium]|jgi:rSAM/selenodomain-associated transferase 1|nr:TIGR04282 family arsenosugar biosynthesis glycosyltransferase [Ktedonobacteraceae bacterium]
MSDTALVVMARTPRLGEGKTRLAASLGPIPTLQLYRAFLTDLARRFSPDNNCDLYWAYTPPESDFASELAQLVPDLSPGTCFPQQGADFASRLHQVFHTMTARAVPRTIVIGSDSPHISCALVSQARLALEENDVVLGPADDGGYYLIGMREPHDLFTGIPMSTSQVFRMTVSRARELSLSVHLLETLFDVDELADFLRLAHLLQDNPDLAPSTASHITHLMKELV